MAVPLNKLQQRVFKVFYRDSLNATSVSSASPQSMLSTSIPELAAQILQHADSFIGIMDANDTLLQLYLDENENQVILELIYPDSTAGQCEVLAYQAALHKISELPAQFSMHWLLEGSSQ